MAEPIRIETGIPDELGGESIVFANVFERPERPGGLSALLLHGETQTLLAPGDRFDLAGATYELAALEVATPRCVAVVKRLDAPAAPESVAHPIPPVAAHELAALLKELTPAILGELSGGAAIPVAEWTSEARDRMHREWNGGETGPVSVTRHVAVFIRGVAAEASVTVEDIRFAPDELYRREVSAYWRSGEASAHVFLRSEGDAPTAALQTAPGNDWLVGLITQAIGAP